MSIHPLTWLLLWFLKLWKHRTSSLTYRDCTNKGGFIHALLLHPTGSPPFLQLKKLLKEHNKLLLVFLFRAEAEYPRRHQAAFGCSTTATKRHTSKSLTLKKICQFTPSILNNHYYWVVRLGCQFLKRQCHVERWKHCNGNVITLHQVKRETYLYFCTTNC